MHFCPLCGTLLLLKPASGSGTEYQCQTCTFRHPVRNATMDSRDMLPSNKAAPEGGSEFDDSALNGGGARTSAACPDVECTSQTAFFIQEQIRSADEPPTTFYKCIKCGTHWRTD
jgi:DNA-directed RNA polymerase III subunit RPC11